MTLRELAPQDLKIELARTTLVEAVALGLYLGRVVGRAHARQVTDADRKAWNTAPKGHRSAALDVPSWLWSSVVDLLGLHEAAYLEHCRQGAPNEAG